MIFSTLSDRPILPAIKGPGRNAGPPHSTDWEPQCQWKSDQPSLAPMIWFKSNQEITCGWKYFQNEISTICRLRPHHPHLGRVCPRFYLLTEGSYPVIRKGPEKKRTPGRSRSCRGKDGRLFISNSVLGVHFNFSQFRNRKLSIWIFSHLSRCFPGFLDRKSVLGYNWIVMRCRWDGRDFKVMIGFTRERRLHPCQSGAVSVFHGGNISKKKSYHINTKEGFKNLFTESIHKGKCL